LLSVSRKRSLPNIELLHEGPQWPLGVGLNLPKHGRNYPYKSFQFRPDGPPPDVPDGPPLMPALCRASVLTYVPIGVHLLNS